MLPLDIAYVTFRFLTLAGSQTSLTSHFGSLGQSEVVPYLFDSNPWGSIYFMNFWDGALFGQGALFNCITKASELSYLL